MPRLPLLLAFLASLTAAPAAEPHPSLPPPVIPDCLGVNIHFTEPKAGELEMLSAAGFKWVRTNLDWAATEPRKGVYDFSAYDRLVAALDPFKIRVVFVLGPGNPLYAAPGETAPFSSRANTPEFREAFGKWAVEAVRHFARRGYLWEMWNEPNGTSWRSPDRTGDYIALAKTTGEKLRRAGLLGGKGEAFVGPAIATVDLSFLEACFQAGLLDYWDAVSVHPSRQTAPEGVENEYRALRLLIRKYAPKDKVIPVIASECGCAGTASGLDLQAAYLGRQFLTNLANDVALSIWSDWRDEAARPGEATSSLVDNEYHPAERPVFHPTPAYEAMKTLHDHLGHFRYNKRLAFSDSPHDFVLLFEREKEVRIAAWTPAASTAALKIPASRGAVLTVATDGTKTDSVMREADNLPFQPVSQVTIVTFPQPNPLLQFAASITRLPLETIFEMPGQSSALPFAFTNTFHEPVLGRVFQPENPLQRPVVAGLTANAELLGPHRSLGTKLKATSWQRSVNGGDKLVVGVGVVANAKNDASQESMFFQLARLIPSNPWIITRLPDTPGDVVIKLENPSGQPWEGSVQVATADRNAPGGGWGQPVAAKTKGPPPPVRPAFVSPPVHLILKPKIHTIIFHIPAASGLGGSTWWRGFDQLIFLPVSGKEIDAPIADNGPVLLDLPHVQVVADGDPKVPLKLAREVAQPPGGPVAEEIPSVRANYSFSPGWKCLRVVNPTWPPPGEKNLLGQPRSMSLWIYGDGRGCAANMRFLDSTNQFFQSNGPKVDWIGWRQVTFPMHRPEDPLEYWGGADDGVIHYPIELDSILVLDNTGRQPVEGTIYVSAPTLNF